MNAKILSSALIVSIAAGLAASQAAPQDPRAAGEEALKDRKYADAVRHLTGALASAKSGQDEILHLVATAQQHAKEYDAAIATLDRLLQEYPESPLRMKAALKRGDVLAAKREFALAAEVYDRHLGAITDPTRRRQIAMAYVNAAREFLTPKDPKDPTFQPEYAAARPLLVKSLEFEALGDEEEAVRLDILACELKGNLPRPELLKSCDAFLGKFPKSAKRDEALFARATALRDLGRRWEAKKDRLRLAQDHSSSPRAAEGVYLAALMHADEFGRTSDLEELRRARPLFRKVASDFAATEWGPKAAYLEALLPAQYEELREEARAALRAFVEANPKDARAPDALLRVAQLHRADFDDAKTIATLEDFLKRFPDSPRWPEVRQSIADVRFDGIQRAFLCKDWSGARDRIAEFLLLHPVDARAAAAAFRTGESLKEEKKFQEAVDAWRKVAEKYPGHDEGHRARYSEAELLANELGDFETALKDLEKVGGGWAGSAAQLRARLQQKSLALESERIFHGGEAPTVRLTVRNVEKVQLKYWSLDLKDYFLKRASTSGLDTLEVAVISPDKEWEYAVPEYKRFQERKLDVELPKKDPGAYIVTAVAENLEAKTVVVVSDLALLARVGRRAATVLVQNRRTGEAVADAAVKLAVDGRHLRTWTDETTASTVSILAEAGGHLAFRDVAAGSLPVPPKREPKAVLLTDRMAYAQEEEVRLQLLLRDVVEGTYAIPKEKKYRLAAVSAQGVTFHEAEVAPSKFGTAAARFRIPEGLWGRVRVDLFEIAKPQEKLVGRTTVWIVPRSGRAVSFDFLHDEGPFHLGDPIDVAIVLRDEWGRPMPGRKIRVAFPSDAEQKDRVTGADGGVPVEIRETEQFYRGNSVDFVVEYEGTVGRHWIPILPKTPALSFDEASRVEEPVIAGDAKTIHVKAQKADETPFPGALKFSVRRTNAAGEILDVASGDVVTDKEGKGSFTFTPKEGGIHTIAVWMRDEEGIPNRVQTAVQVFDDTDERKLRLLSDADEFEPGKPMEFSLLSRLEPGLAFVAVEGEKVELTTSVRVAKGRTAIHLGPAPSATDDYSVTVMMMQGNKFYADTRTFRQKEPEVKVDPGKKEYRPGEEATVRVTAKPGSEVLLVAAESLRIQVGTGAFLPSRPGPHFTGDSSAATAFSFGTREMDPELTQALARLDALNDNPSVRVMMQRDLRRLAGLVQEEVQDAIGEGDGAGGRYGGQMGGRRNLVSRGGGSRESEPRTAEERPLIFAVAEADASGVATFSFPLPYRHGDYTLVARAVDGTNSYGRAFGELKVRAPVVAEFRLPESAVEGEKTSAIVLLTNTTGKEQEVALKFAGTETTVKIAARSTLEKTFEWIAARSASITIDGIERTAEVALREKAPTGRNETGGAFAAATEVTLDGVGPMTIRIATSPEALLESLSEGRDPITSASDAAARLIARTTRHRREATDATKAAVMEFAARDAAGLRTGTEDAAEPVLLYLASAEAKSAGFEIEPDAAPLKARFAREKDDEVKVLILFALTRGGAAEYGYLHRFWRRADTLSPRSLACVALAMKALGKSEEAREVVGRLAGRVKEDHWDAAEVSSPDSSNTSYATTALAAFAVAEVEPGHALLPKVRAWLLSRRPSTAFERAALALAMQSVTERGGVGAVRVGGREIRGYGEVTTEEGRIEPAGAGTYYVFASRSDGKAVETPGVTRKSKAQWPLLRVEGVTVTAVEESVDDPAMTRVAAGEKFVVKTEFTVAGPRTQYRVVEIPRTTGLRVREEQLRVLLPPQTEAERKVVVYAEAYADAPGANPEIEVLPAGAEYRTADWKMTSWERLGAGRILFGAKKWKEAREILEPLFEKGTLQDEAMVEAARMLAYSAVELGAHEAVVRYFEVMKEKSPAEVVPFDKIRGVGRAYAAMKEPERAMQVYSGACDAYFLQEAAVVGMMEERGRWKEAIEWTKRLLREHPDTTLNREMLFGFGQRLYTKGRELRGATMEDPHVPSSLEFLRESAASLERCLAWFPESSDADRVMLTLGSSYLEPGEYAAAERAGKAAAGRHPKSRFLDAFDYTQAFALFAQKKFPEALAMCDRLETFDYGRHANPGPMVMRLQGVLMKAQIHHAKGEMELALENYKKVRKESADAQRSIAFLEREALLLPEVTVSPTAKPAEVELEYSGVAEARVRAYKVDLTMLALRRRSLADPASVEVAGIRPVVDATVKLEHPNARRREREKLSLDLKEPGAYLVGVKAGDFFAGGLVLRSDLSMTVQEELSGAVRVNVADVAKGACAEGVKVTIFGTDDGRIASDKTDLRGIWETEGVHGLAVVVAEKDGHVAMHRGQAALGRMPDPQQQTRQMDKQIQEQQKELLNDQLNEANGLYERNWSENTRKAQQGVEVERTKKR